ncbi:MAG: hypothetical protein J4F35_10230 [Candidatus Latescibacteria bacterium]|nr:hypothetical protein [Candidatus Latescibacterota bacterium]
MPTHRLRFLPLLSVLLSVILLDGAWAQSQSTTGVIRGSVWDQFGNPIANATVVLKETRTNYERTLTSSDLGLFTATFGRSSGGFVNVITKSGTNQLHGSVHFFGKNDALSGTARHEGLERARF